MQKEINLGFNIRLEISDTSYAKSFDLLNDETKMAQELGMRLK